MSGAEVRTRAQHLLDLRRPAEAEAVVRTHLGQEPEDVDALVLLARALLDQDRDDEGDRALRAALRLDPEHYSALLTLVDVSARADHRAAALAAADRALALHPDAWTSHYAKAMALMSGTQPRPVPALDCVDRGLRTAPHEPSLHNLAGVCLDAMMRPDEARRAFEEALRLDPQHVLAGANLAGLDAEGGRLRRSARRLTASLAEHPGEAALHRLLPVLVTRFALRLLCIAVVAAVVLGVELGREDPWPVRAATGAVLLVGLALTTRSFLRQLPRGPGSWIGRMVGEASGAARLALGLLALALPVLLVLAFAPAGVAAATGITVLVVLRTLLLGSAVVWVARAALGLVRS
ncbi:tetratricopeptide repeat protein [Nocardioides salarius]|uniref:tetratricopeptide repeat protein n=1 Tax=Nocardioides salarius TaxID=374513 RepID=UPI0030FACDB6